MQFQPNPPQGQPRELNLQKMAEQFLMGMQRHFDMLCFNLVSREAANESAYLEKSRLSGAMPVVPLHQNFEQMQAQARDLLNAQILNDSLNLCFHVINNCHLFLAVIKANHENPGQKEKVQQLVQQNQQAFVAKQMDQKFNDLEQEYGVMCELEDTILSFGFAIQAFAQQAGIVREPQLDDNQELPFELVYGKDPLNIHDLARQPTDYATESKAFKEGEKISFSDKELQGILNTVTLFALQLFRSVQTYGQEHPMGS
ncbi:MAG: hypothetical protein LR015_05810 [Verrucomicrobia bacterium]|nr:hypothetical protein [Verrucomicrobiota bacterium]